MIRWIETSKLFRKPANPANPLLERLLERRRKREPVRHHELQQRNPRRVGGGKRRRRWRTIVV